MTLTNQDRNSLVEFVDQNYSLRRFGFNVYWMIIKFQIKMTIDCFQSGISLLECSSHFTAIPWNNHQNWMNSTFSSLTKIWILKINCFDLKKAIIFTLKSKLLGSILGWDKIMLDAPLFWDVVPKNKQTDQNKSHIFIFERFS